MQTSAVAEAAKGKLAAMIQAGESKARAGLEAINREFQIRQDFMVKPSGLDVAVKARDLLVEIKGKGRYGTTPFARNQLLDMAKVPTRFADTLADHDLGELLRVNVKALLDRTQPGGLLVREVGGTAKGILSPSYKLMDGSPLYEAFIGESIKAGLVPHSGTVSETRSFIQFIQPRMIEILPGEFTVFGIELRNSDYGNGALALAITLWRLLCTNGMVGTDLLRRVHLGKRFEDFGSDSVIKLSERTKALDVATLTSGLRDAMKALPEHIDATVESIRSVATDDVPLRARLDLLGKRGLTKATLDKVKALYETEQPVEALPSQPGAWRFGNVLGLLANSANVTPDEAHDLRDLAFEVMKPKVAA